MNKVELSEMIGGALQEKFGKAFERVIENLQDQNTPFKTKRGITIKLSFHQNEARDDVQVDIDVEEKLAAQTGMRTSFCIGKDLKTGEIFAEEYGRQVKGQMSVKDIKSEETQAIPVDPETGEVLENRNSNVIDLRKVAF